MPGLSDLLSDPNASIEVIVGGSYLDENDSLTTSYFSRSGWADPPDGEYGQYIPPLLDITLRVSQSANILDPKHILDGPYSEIRLINDSIYTEYVGIFDSWWKYSVDLQPWNVYIVGTLSSGVRVELSDVILNPLYALVGIDIPEVSSSECIIRTRSQSQVLDTALQPVTYSPPCLLFPGTTSGIVNLGDNIDITGNQSISAWIYIDDPITTTQYLIFKDGTTTGHYISVGLCSGGVTAGVEVCVRGQSPAVSTTAAGVLRAFQWHRIDISIGTADRRIDIDGTTAVTTTSITGAPTGNALNHEIGRSFKGRIHRLLFYSNARSNAIMSAEGRTPIIGAESNLREAFLFLEGSGLSTISSKSGSSLTGTIHSSVLWDTASWHYGSILGQYEPYVLGTVPRVPVSWIDPPKQVGQVSKGAIALLSELQSNHTAVSSANYTVDLTNSTFKVTSGALSGTYSATVTANNLWNSALLFNGTSSRTTATLTMPAGSKYIGCHIRVDNTSSANRQIAGWNGATSVFLLRMDTSGSNILTIVAANDAGGVFTASTTIREKRRYSVLASLNIASPSSGLQLYLNGVLVATTAISGNWTGTQTTLSVGHRSTAVDFFFPGVIDELIVGNVAGTLAIAQAHHTKPVTSALTGILAGWHLDEGAGSTAAPFVSAVSMTLTNLTWTAGRSAPVDLARVVLFANGYEESDLDSTTWLEALNDNMADCGWFVSSGQKSIDVLNVVLCGLGFILIESFGVFKIKRFEGLSGVASKTFNPNIDSIMEMVIAQSSDPAVYQWIIQFATNNTKLDAANVAGSLASTDPDRYSYGSAEFRSVTKTDGVTLERFPGALTKVRRTALLNLLDAETEALRLLPIHKHGADKKVVAMFISLGDVEILDEIGPLQAETDLDQGTFIVCGIEIDEETGHLVVWRPA